MLRFLKRKTLYFINIFYLEFEKEKKNTMNYCLVFLFRILEEETYYRRIFNNYILCRISEKNKLQSNSSKINILQFVPLLFLQFILIK